MVVDVEVREQLLSVEVAVEASLGMEEVAVAMALTTVRGTSAAQELADTQDEVQTHILVSQPVLLHPMVVVVAHLAGSQVPTGCQQAVVWVFLVVVLAAAPLVMVFLEV
jgi:hypothetical protein